MTPTELTALRRDQPREFDAAVAKAMGWTDFSIALAREPSPCGAGIGPLPAFSRDPAADYTVLEHVRGLGEKIQRAMQDHLADIFLAGPRDELGLSRREANYRPGDWSEAFLLTQQEKSDG